MLLPGSALFCFLFFPFSSQQFLLSVLTVWTSHPTRAMSNWRKSCCLPLKKQKDLDKSNCWDLRPPEDRNSSAVPVPSFSACCTSYCKLGLWLESYLSVSRLMLLGFTFQWFWISPQRFQKADLQTVVRNLLNKRFNTAMKSPLSYSTRLFP